MSNSSSLTEAAFVEGVELNLFSLQTSYASTALLVYAYVLTLPREIELVWKHLRRPSSWMYLLIRYPGLLSQLLAIGLNSDTPGEAILYDLLVALNILANTMNSVVQILRTAAICGPDNRMIATGLTLLLLPLFALDILKSFGPGESPGFSLRSLFAACGLALALESAIIFITLWRMWRLASYHRRYNAGQYSLVESIIRNGLLYYTVTLVFDVVLVPCILLQNNRLTTSVFIFINSFGDQIRWILISQFILELRERSQPSSLHAGASRSLSSSSPSGSMSVHATIQFVQNACDEDFGEPPYPTGQARAWRTARGGPEDGVGETEGSPHGDFMLVRRTGAVGA